MEALTKRYRQLIRIYHPDNGGDAELIKDINLEYEALKKQMAARA
jgi:curved DNA-binding protein CbpA